MDTKTSRQDGPSLHTELARLDDYTILKLAHISNIIGEMMFEDWLESVYSKTTAPAKVLPAEILPTRALQHGSDQLSRDYSPSEGRVLASHPPNTTETSAPCDVDTTFIERKTYQWRKWAMESV